MVFQTSISEQRKSSPPAGGVDHFSGWELDRGEDGVPEVTLASGPLTSFKGEVEQKIKGKKMTLSVSHWQTGQEGRGKEATAQNCSPGNASVW